MRADVQEIDGFRWSGEKASWVDKDYNPVSRKKAKELHDQSEVISQQQIMERLNMARAAFQGMSGYQERMAAVSWLIEAYDLKLR